MRKMFVLGAVLVLFWLLGVLPVSHVDPAQARMLAQQTSLPSASPPSAPPPSTNGGVIATVNSGDQEQINVRSGPGTDYALIGALLAGQKASAVGRSPGGDWIEIVYPAGSASRAWVYAYLVTLSGSLPIVEPPPTPTLAVTPTIDPTLAAQFIVDAPPTRLPTYTPPPPLAIPTYTEPAVVNTHRSSEIVYLIIGLGVIGVLGVLLSFIRIRS